MMRALLDRLLGTDARQRVRLGRFLQSASVYGFCLVLTSVGASLGLMSSVKVTVMWSINLLGLVAFYIALRSGLSLRAQDPALTMPQMIFAILSISLAYDAVDPMIRGLMPMLMALVLVFGAFILPPQRCLQLGWLSVAALAVMTVLGAVLRPDDFPLLIEVFQLVLIAVVLPLIGSLAGQLSALRAQQRAQKQELREALERVQQLATYDDLTGLPNRRHVIDLLAHEERRSLRREVPLCICLMDIDHFKKVNDTHGHQAGDEALRQFAAFMASALRAGDVLARWGGEEFILLLPVTPAEEAAPIVERLRVQCADPVTWAVHPHLRVTFPPACRCASATSRPRPSLRARMRRFIGPNAPAATAWPLANGI